MIKNSPVWKWDNELTTQTHYKSFGVILSFRCSLNYASFFRNIATAITQLQWSISTCIVLIWLNSLFRVVVDDTNTLWHWLRWQISNSAKIVIMQVEMLLVHMHHNHIQQTISDNQVVHQLVKLVNYGDFFSCV